MARRGLPIAAQVMLLLLGGLLAAQVATVFIALLLPPHRTPAFRLVEIAGALKGGPLPTGGEPLVRTRQAARPAPTGAGWMSLPRPRADLARMLGVPLEDVEVRFFLTPPFAGAAPPPRPPWGGPYGRGPGGPPPPGSDWGAHRPPDEPGRGAEPPPADGLHPPPMGAGEPYPHEHHFGPYVDGAFVAGLKTASGWVVIRPAPTLLSGWERRVLLWFALSFAVIGPVGYLFARRLTAPLASFVAAAERMGRDVRAPPVSVQGPAEVQRAAHALNSMQVRLGRHIEDRTAMIGAISHDLRTPLARLKFRLERVPAEVRTPMLADISQMEAMLTSVLTFIRDASEPGPREVVDLRSIAECVVDDAALLGAPAVLEAGDPLLVEADPGAIQRVLANLVDNAVKYGGEAQVQLDRVGEEARVRVADRGPGLKPSDLARVFEPFYRAEAARTLGEEGVGLGLSIARSIARAHGGEVELHPAALGLVAELRLPAQSSAR